MKLILIRHGATEWSSAARHTGRTDIPLSLLGLRQAEFTRDALPIIAGEGITGATIFSSPLSRALTTARGAVGADREIIVANELIEYDYGLYEGLTPAEIRRERPDWNIWSDGCPGGESTKEVGIRADAFLERLPESGEFAIAFAHGHIIRILAARAVGLDAEMGSIFTLDTATLSIIEDVRGLRVIKLWNVDPEMIVRNHAG